MFSPRYLRGYLIWKSEKKKMDVYVKVICKVAVASFNQKSISVDYYIRKRLNDLLVKLIGKRPHKYRFWTNFCLAWWTCAGQKTLLFSSCNFSFFYLLYARIKMYVQNIGMLIFSLSMTFACATFFLHLHPSIPVTHFQLLFYSI